MRLRAAPAALFFALGSTFAVGSTRCARSLPHPRYAPQPATALVEVTSPPPPGRIEDVPARPTGGTFWIDGEWTWRRGRWAWIAGRWVETPEVRGATFSPWVFVRGADGRMWYAPGTWRGPAGEAMAPPRALAPANVEATIVVDARGQTQTTGPTRVTPSAAATGH